MKIFTEKASKNLIWIGVALILIGAVSFVIGEKIFDFGSEIKSDKIGQLGDYFGGVIGSLWALAGVILFYVALKRQTEALKDQQKATKATVDALDVQKTELELQRKELKYTREEFKINRLTNILFKQVEHINNVISNSKFFVEHKGEIPEKQLTIDKLIFILDTLKSKSNDKSNYHRMDFLITLNTGRIIRLLASVHALLEGFEKLLNKSSIEEQEINQLKGLLKGNLNQDFYELLLHRVKFIENDHLDNSSLLEQDIEELKNDLIKLEISKIQYILTYDR